MRIMRIVCWLALPVGILVGALNAANAEVSDEVRQACTPDAMRLCSQFIPDAGKVRTCMLAKRRQLSETCRLAMSHGGGRHVRHASRHRERHVRHHRRHR